MNLTDQEQVILKAIYHIGRNGIAPIASVVKAVGYPKATTKKLLVKMADKNIVVLHRHDYPTSLSSAERKLLIRRQDGQGRWHYFTAVSVMKQNPKGEHLRGATAKQERQYEHFLESAKKYHRYGRRKKEVAARIVKARQNPKRHKNGLSAKEKLLVINQAYQKHRAVIAKRFDRMTLDQAHAEMKKADQRSIQDTIHKLSMDAARPETREIEKANPTKQGKGKTALKKTGRALKGFAQGALSAGAQILGAGAAALNPVRRRTKKAKKKAGKRNAARTVHLTRKTKAGRVRAVSKTGHKTSRAKTVKVRSVAKTRKVSTRRAAGRAIKKSSRVLKRRGRKNPSAEEIRKKFAGRVSGERDVFVPSSAPKGKLAKLGKLVSITTEEGTIKPVHGSAVLLADTKGKLHVGSLTNAPLFSGPARSFGQVKRIEYDDSKPHLGFKSPIIWHHKMGEETGHRPTLHADGQGGLVFRGGRYRLTARGIEN